MKIYVSLCLWHSEYITQIFGFTLNFDLKVMLPIYFIMLAHDIRGGCCCDGDKGWTFPPIFHYTVLPCDGRQQRGSLIQWLWHGSVYEAQGWNWMAPTDIAQYLLNVYGDQTVSGNSGLVLAFFSLSACFKNNVSIVCELNKLKKSWAVCQENVYLWKVKEN